MTRPGLADQTRAYGKSDGDTLMVRVPVSSPVGSFNTRPPSGTCSASTGVERTYFTLQVVNVAEFGGRATTNGVDHLLRSWDPLAPCLELKFDGVTRPSQSRGLPPR
jgi:hypothetical protein